MADKEETTTSTIKAVGSAIKKAGSAVKDDITNIASKAGSAVKDHIADHPGRLAAAGAMLYALKKYNDAKKKGDQYDQSEYSDMANTAGEAYTLK